MESITKYKKYTHGEAVVQGIFFVLKWAYKQEMISYSYYRLSIELLTKYGFKEELLKYTPEDLISIMRRDKKASDGKITFIVPCDKKRVKEVKLTEDDVFKMF